MREQFQSLPTLHRDKLLRQLDRCQHSSFQVLYREMMDRPPINGTESQNDAVLSQDSGQPTDFDEPQPASGSNDSNTDNGSPFGTHDSPIQHDSGAVSGNDDMNDSFEVISNPSQPTMNLRNPRRFGQPDLDSFQNPSREYNMTNAFINDAPIDEDVSPDLGIYHICKHAKLGFYGQDYIFKLLLHDYMM